jgi:mRNA (guanine-N7-)-methyltransferase
VAHAVKPGDSVIDFGCGRGIDVSKWDRAGVAQYVAVDGSPDALGEARARWAGLPKRAAGSAGAGVGALLPPPQAEFLRMDPCADLIDPCDCPARFDVATCLEGAATTHRCCCDEPTARLFLANVASRLKPGGVFIGIVPDAAEIFRAASKLQMASSSSSQAQAPPVIPAVVGELHRLSFTADRFREWGTGYSWQIGDDSRASGYLINWRRWSAVAAQAGLALLEAVNFLDLAEEYQQPFAERIRQQGLSQLHGAQLEIIRLFTTFVFRKD